ncbi:MAG TPA: tetratricopeptide repeat protein [Methanoregulaceae archaeon]|nr:tetratricopeptide repeat protein [Methanoregulaceae archaeon]
MRFRQYSLILALSAWCALIGVVCAAADCGCGGLPDSSPPSGWSDAGNSAMSSYSGFGGTGSGSGTGNSYSDQGNTGSGTSGGDGAGPSSSSGTDSGSANSGSSGTASSGSSAGSFSDQALALTSQGIAQFRQGDLNKSLDSLNRSLALDPYSEKTWITTGDVLSAMGRLNESLEAYTHGLHLDKTDPALYVKIADVQVRTGAYSTAVASYDRALALQPNLPQAIANRTKAAALASGLVVMATTQPSPPPAGEDTYEITAPPASVTTVPVPQTTRNQAPFPVLLAVSAAGFVMMFCRGAKNKER